MLLRAIACLPRPLRGGKQSEHRSLDSRNASLSSWLQASALLCRQAAGQQSAVCAIHERATHAAECHMRCCSKSASELPTLSDLIHSLLRCLLCALSQNLQPLICMGVV